MKKQSVIYYTGLVIQKLSILNVIGWTVVYWILTITLAVNIQSVYSTGGHFTDRENVDKTIKLSIDTIGRNALLGAVTALILTIGLLALPRVRKYQKHMIIIDVTVIAFCMISIVFAQTLVRQFISKLAV